MKKSLFSYLIILALFINNYNDFPTQPLNTFINLELENDNLKFFELNQSNHLSRFNATKAVYSGLVSSYLDGLGVNQAHFNLYDQNYNLVNQLIVMESDFSQFSAFDVGAIISSSNTIWVNNYLITYYQSEETFDESSRHKLMVVDLTNYENPVYKFVELTNTGVAIIETNIKESFFNLALVNNYIYLTSINEIGVYSIATINFDLSLDLNDLGYNVGSANGIASSSSSFMSPGESTSLDYCQNFGTNVYCLDLAFPDQLIYLDITYLNSVNDILLHGQDLYSLELVEDLYQLNLYHIEVIEITDDLFELALVNKTSVVIEDASVDFAHFDYKNENFTFFNNQNKYIISLLDYALTQQSFIYNTNKRILYNQLGKRLEVDVSKNLILADSDFENKIFSIPTYGYQILKLNYYQDKLLFVAFDESLAEYYYFSYLISDINSVNPTPELIFSKLSLLNNLNAAYYDRYEYNNVDNIEFVNFIFNKDELYVIDEGRLVTDNYINIIRLLTNEVVQVYPFDVFGLDLTFNHTYSLMSKNDQDVIKFYVYGLFDADYSAISFQIDLINQNSTLVVESSSNDSNLIGSYKPNINQLIEYYLVVETLTLNMKIFEDNLEFNTYSIKLPSKSLEAMVNNNIGLIYQSFINNFPYYYIYFHFDDFANLYLTDYLNNIHIIYNYSLMTNNQVGKISINNDSNYNINANVFDLLVISTINSVIIELKPYFNQVFVNNSSPFSLNFGTNSIVITIKSINNSIRNLTFNVFRAPNIQQIPPIILPGLDPNYVSSSSSGAIISSSISSSFSQTSSSFFSSSSLITSSSGASVISSSSTIAEIEPEDLASVLEDYSLLTVFLLIFPLLVTLSLIIGSNVFKNKRKKAIKSTNKAKSKSKFKTKN